MSTLNHVYILTYEDSTEGSTETTIIGVYGRHPAGMQAARNELVKLLAKTSYRIPEATKLWRTAYDDIYEWRLTPYKRYLLEPWPIL